MPIIRFNPTKSNFLVDGDKRFFLMSHKGLTFLVKDNCPHRGGPLHLGCLNNQQGSIICPWHNSSVSIQSLRNSAIPLVLHHTIAIAILPKIESPSVVTQQRTIF
jgi:hypothetical protein